MSGRGRTGRGQGRGGRAGRSGRGSNYSGSAQTRKTQGKCAELGTDVFDYNTSGAADQTRTTWKAVIIYAGAKYGQDIANELENRKTLTIPKPTYSDETLAVLVPAGKKVEIMVPFQDDLNTSIREGPTCGLVPMGSKVDSITTSGLKWNLENSETEFGGLLSTSNHVVGDNGMITVETTQPIFFTAEVVCPDRALSSK